MAKPIKDGRMGFIQKIVSTPYRPPSVREEGALAALIPAYSQIKERPPEIL